VKNVLLLRERRSNLAIAKLVGAFALHYNAHGFEQQLEIQSGSPVADISGVEFDAAAVGGVVAAGNLPQARQAGLCERVQ
jgi:hypothetical protein